MTDKTHPSGLIDPELQARENLRILPVTIVYGANAAGKSNILRGLEYLQDAVLFSHSSWSPNKGTRLPQLNVGQHDGDARFEIEFILRGIKYRYGFMDNGRFFSEEWLYQQATIRESRLFHRVTARSGDSDPVSSVKFGPGLSGGLRYLRTIEKRTRENSLFLSASAQENQIELKDIFEYIQDEFRVHPLNNAPSSFDGSSTTHLARSSRLFKSVLLDFIKMADPAISEINFKKKDSEPKSRSFSKSVSEEVREYFRERDLYEVEFVLKAKGERIVLPFQEESRGVQKVYSLADAILSTLQFGGLFVVDELESSMHPHIAKYIIDLFHDPAKNIGKAQLIVVTHDTNLLDQSLLRRDQIWFVEKVGLHSHLYSLLDFSPRKDENLEQGYLRGRYGAIPSLRSIPLSIDDA